MKISNKYLTVIIAVGMIFFCTACSGLNSLADNLKSGAEQLSNNVAIGKSNALITPYQSFSGSRTSDNGGFTASFEGDVESFNGQDILVGNTNVKKNSCREIIINYEFDTEKGSCKLIYLNPDLEERVLAESGKGEITLELQTGANYIGLIGEDYQGHIQITVQ